MDNHKENIREKIERWKLLADIFVKNNSKVFLKTINGNFHFCIVVLNGEDSLLVENFAPEQRSGNRDKIYWVEVETFEEYKEEKKAMEE